MGAYEESPPKTRPPHTPDSDLATFTAAARVGLMEENSLLNECRFRRATCPKLSHSVSLLLRQSCILQVSLQTQQTPCASWCLEAASSVPVTAGAAGLCANAPMLGLAARPWPARRAVPADGCTHMPTHSTASCAWPGASTISLPAPQPTLDYACSKVRGEAT